jgi:hypothetical protein
MFTFCFLSAGSQRYLSATCAGMPDAHTTPAGNVPLSHPLVAVVDLQLRPQVYSGGPYRCVAEVSLEMQHKGSGYTAHPAVTDNCMQLGPMTGLLEADASSQRKTRVVASLAAFCARYTLTQNCN